MGFSLLEKGFMLGFALIAAGIVVIMVTVFLAALRGSTEGKYGAVIVVGPIPVIVGNDSSLVKIAVIGAIILIALSLILLLAPNLLYRRLGAPTA